MKIAIDVSPLQSGHKVRGVGFYLENLKQSLQKDFPNNNYLFFTQKKDIDRDVEVVHYPYFEPFFVTLPMFKKHKQVITVHDLTPLVFPEHFPSGIRGSIAWKLQKHNLRGSDQIITDSEASKKDIVRLAGVDEEKIAVVYLAAADSFKRMANGKWRMEVQKKYNLPDSFVLYVGDVTWNKNLPRLIKAIQEINLHKGDHGLPLVMVGKTLVQKDFDQTNPWNKDLVEVNKLVEGDKRIIRLGFVPTEDLVALYNSATVFVMPSIYEGFGLPVIEAMQCGTPVVTTRGGSLPEVAGEAAFYVDQYDISSIANGIGEVFFNKKLQQSFSEKGLKQAKKFSWKLTAEQTLKAYEKAVRRG